jgi:hypothetical protein
MAEDGDQQADAWKDLIEAYDGLMCGWANFAPGTDDGDFEGGAVLVVARAEDGEDFERQAQEVVENAGHAFVGTERLRWLGAWAGVSLEVFPLAAEAVESGAPAAGAFFTYAETKPLWELEGETVEWDEVKASADLVEIVTDESQMRGVLLDFSDELVLVQHVDMGVILLDGYGLYPRSEVLRFEALAETFVPQALKVKGQVVQPIEAPLANLREFFRWVKGAAPLVSVYESRESPDGQYVGAVIGVTEDAVTVRGVDSRGQWVDEYEHLLRDVTRVDFLDNYLTALALVVQERP